MSRNEAVVALARAFTHEVGVRLIDELGAGEATVSDLAVRLQLPQPSVSAHLAVLKEAGLVEAEVRGRHRAYRLRGEAPALALAALRTLADECRFTGESQPAVENQPAGEQHSAGQRQAARVRQDPSLRDARTCYDHLAGVAGVRLLDGLLERRWLEPASGHGFRLTTAGEAALARAGVDLEAAQRARRAFAIGCLDWTERRPHLGGALGSALLAAMLRQERARPRPGSRSVALAAGEPHAFLDSGSGGRV